MFILYDCKQLEILKFNSLKDASDMLEISMPTLSRQLKKDSTYNGSYLFLNRFKCFKRKPTLNKRKEALEIYYSKVYKNEAELWKETSFDKDIIVSSLGRVKVKDSLAMPFVKLVGRKALRKVVMVKAKNKSYAITSLVRGVFMEHDGDKLVVVSHINGDIYDNRLSNLRLMTKSEHGRMTGGMARGRSIIVFNINGEIKDIYKSAREAGRVLSISYQAILDSVNKGKYSYATETYKFLWLDQFEERFYEKSDKCEQKGGHCSK